jgi:hypothetical protein
MERLFTTGGDEWRPRLIAALLLFNEPPFSETLHHVQPASEFVAIGAMVGVPDFDEKPRLFRIQQFGDERKLFTVRS